MTTTEQRVEYLVNDVYPTIQGEGVHTGVPMILLRLHGCPVGCPWCDSKETWTVEPANERLTLEQVLGSTALYVKMKGREIAAQVFNHHAKVNGVPLVSKGRFERWVLISGGEPASFELAELVGWLHLAGFRVAVETSGTMTGILKALADWVTVSPKIDMPGGLRVLPAVLAIADEIKFPVGRIEDVFKLDELLDGAELKEGCAICLQPISESKAATRVCVEQCMKRGWRLSCQIHKIAGLR